MLQHNTRNAFRHIEALEQCHSSLLRDFENRLLILMGEATHGTREFYQIRAHLTKRLILQQGISAVAIEGDWPSVRWRGSDCCANEALQSFSRFPLWMWRNTTMLEFIEWLRQYNQNRPPELQVGLYGLDMYSLYESVDLVTRYLDGVDPAAAQRAREHYACLDQAHGDLEEAALDDTCRKKVLAELINLRQRSRLYTEDADAEALDEQFYAEQNARLVVSAEAYYRQMFASRRVSWNTRDSHMFDTLVCLQEYLSRRSRRPARMVVWEHNSHLGDARATSMGTSGEHNVGQLARQRFDNQVYLLGFTTFTGTVTAASRWDGPSEKKQVLDAMEGSVEHLFHQASADRFFLPLNRNGAKFENTILHEPLLQRAIGVLYLPKTERQSHYMTCRIANQFDGVIHVDQTSAVEPLDKVSERLSGEEATYPFGT